MAGGNRGTIAAIFAALLLLSGCGSAPPPPAVVQLSMVAGPDINPDMAGRAAPVLVRVFQLATPNKFERADFFQLSDNEQATLGSDLLGKDGIIISPGQTQRLTINMEPGAAFLGVAASFRNIDKAKWRGEVPIPSSGTVAVGVTIRGLVLTVAKSGP